MPATPDIQIRREGRAGRITLDRPAALNALTYGMLTELRRALDDWRNDRSVEVVILDGAGGRALCAGGDVLSLYDASTKGKAPDATFAPRFWHDEYYLNASIPHYPKPYVALMDGVVMGGGVGLSAHARHRFVTERTMVAMPETAIGLIPDVGGTWLLGHAQGRFGEYLGLTGARMDGSDAIQAGFADGYLPSAEIPAFVARLADPKAGTLDDIIEAALDGPVPMSKLAAAQGLLRDIFSGTTVTDIVAAAAKSAHPLAQKISADLATRSPKAMTLALAAIRQARTLPTLEAALDVEYRLVVRLYRDVEFIEGIRALLVDKDKAPRWNPPTLAAVSDDMVRAYLAPLESGELGLSQRLAQSR